MAHSAPPDNVDVIAASLVKDGFVTVKNFFMAQDLERLESCVVDLFQMQAMKIGEYRSKAIQIQNCNDSHFEKFSQLYEMMELDDKEALYQVQKFLTSSPVARGIFGDSFLRLVKSLLASTDGTLLVDGPALFVNRPNTERLLYKWHSESHYYPKRRRFLNIWFPLFDKKRQENGTMSFKVSSHRRDFPFSDYQGFNRNTQGASNHFVQYEIPESLLGGFDEHWCEVDPGDLVIFDRALVHRSNQNKSSAYSVAVVARVWDPSDDLTLSGSMAATPYGGNIGRADFVVRDF
jgi:hypothetical protein